MRRGQGYEPTVLRSQVQTVRARARVTVRVRATVTVSGRPGRYHPTVTLDPTPDPDLDSSPNNAVAGVVQGRTPIAISRVGVSVVLQP